jgi:hypothetical protein
MIQIDVHPAGENLINTAHAFHTRFVYSNLSLVVNSIGRILLLSTPPLNPTEWPMGPALVSLPTQPLKQ